MVGNDTVMLVALFSYIKKESLVPCHGKFCSSSLVIKRLSQKANNKLQKHPSLRSLRGESDVLNAEAACETIIHRNTVCGDWTNCSEQLWGINACNK